MKLAEAVIKATEQPIDFKFLYDLQVSNFIKTKAHAIIKIELSVPV